MTRLDAQLVKDAAAGRWPEILEHVAGIPRELLDGKHHGCPKCGDGVDRFRLLDADAGAVFCNQCFRERNGDGLAAVQWMLGTEFPESVQRVGDYLGLTNGKTERAAPADVLTSFCRAKRITVDSFLAYGATEERRNGSRVARVPMYGPDGVQCSHCDFSPIGESLSKGLNAKGKTPGLFLPHDVAADVVLPKAGETWLITEGVKDACALHALGYLACGRPGAELGAAFARLFRGATVVLVPDLDKKGMEGAEKSRSRLVGIAAGVTLARLPGELKASSGADVRDVLAKPGGEQLVRQAIDDALAELKMPDTSGTTWISLPSVASQWLADFENDKPPVVYPTGLPWEVAPGGLLMLGGAPACGKSTLAIQSVVDALMNDSELRAVICNVEMTPDKLFERAVSLLCGVPARAVRLRGELLLARERQAIRDAWGRLHDTIGERLRFVLAPHDMANVAAVARDHDARIVVVDYIQRVQPVHSADMEQRQAINQTLDLCRALCMDGRAVLAISSLKRPPNTKTGRGYHSAQLTDFKESGECEYGVDDAYVMVRDPSNQNRVTLHNVKRRYDSLQDFTVTQLPSLRFQTEQPERFEVFDQFNATGDWGDN